MSSFTFNIEVDKQGTSREPKRYPVYIRVYDRLTRKQHRYKTEVTLSKAENWNPKKLEIRCNTERGYETKWTEQIHKELEKLRDSYTKLEEQGLASAENIILDAQGKYDSTSFLEFARQIRDDIFETGRYNYGKRNNTLVVKLEAFLKVRNKKDLLFKEVTEEFVHQFETFLLKQPNTYDATKTLSQNAVGEILTILKTVVHKAVRYRKILPQEDPFIMYRVNRGKPKPKESLNEKEIETLENLEFEESSRGFMMRMCKDMFLLSVYIAGARFEDIVTMRWYNIQVTPEGETRIIYTMLKNGKHQNLVLIPEAVSLLSHYFHDGVTCNSDYIFPLMDKNADYAKAKTYEEVQVLPPKIHNKFQRQIGSKNALVNRYLKNVMKMAEIDKSISFHCGRHSFAHRAEEEGCSLYKLQNLLLHSNTKDTLRYMGNLSTSDKDAIMKNIFKPKDNKEKAKSLIDNLNSEELIALREALAERTNNNDNVSL